MPRGTLTSISWQSACPWSIAKFAMRERGGPTWHVFSLQLARRDAHSVTPHFQVPLTCCDAIRGRWPTVSGTSTRRPRAKLSWRFASSGSPCCSLRTALRRYLRTREVWRGRRRGRGRGEGGDDEGGKGITARESVHKWDTKVSAPLSYNIFEELQTETGIRAP